MVECSLPNGIRGLVIAAALAALMSTASAGLLAASTTVTRTCCRACARRGQSDNGDVHENRIATLLLGLVVLGIALVVSDVISALTVAYNLLVGGMLIPLIGAIYWKRATAGAITSMTLGFLTVLVFMIRTASTPIRRSTTAWRSACSASSWSACSRGARRCRQRRLNQAQPRQARDFPSPFPFPRT